MVREQLEENYETMTRNEFRSIERQFLYEKSYFHLYLFFCKCSVYMWRYLHNMFSCIRNVRSTIALFLQLTGIYKTHFRFPENLSYKKPLLPPLYIFFPVNYGSKAKKFKQYVELTGINKFCFQFPDKNSCRKHFFLIQLFSPQKLSL